MKAEHNGGNGKGFAVAMDAFSVATSDPASAERQARGSEARFDIFDKCSTAEGNFGPQRQSGDSYFTRPLLDDKPGPRMHFDGRECVMWSVNDYLGFAGDPELRRIAAATASEWGASGPMGSRMMSGTTTPHLDLERSLADLCGKPDSVLFNYGYMGVLGTIQALTEPDDILVMDKMSHACIVDAARMSATGRNLRVFRHNDLASLERLLKSVQTRRKGGVLILTEGIFGMTGDCAPLDGIVELKEKYNARLFVDDAHGFGVVGPDGRGASALHGVMDKTDIYFSTFAKAFASIGGFSASEHSVVEWIKYNARSQVFAKSLPMIFVKTAQRTLELMATDGDERRRRMWHMSRLLADGLRSMGFEVQHVPSPVVPVLLPSARVVDCMTWSRYLRQRGIFVSPVVYPVVPRGMALFRMIPTASHTEADVEETLAGFRALRDEFSLDLAVDPQVVRTVYGPDAATIGQDYGRMAG